MKSCPTHRISGFSLVELLVVIAIIALLAGLSYGSFSAISKSAAKAEAASQMKQIGVAINLYRADNNDKLPGPLWPGQQPYYDPDDVDAAGRLVNQLQPYIGLPDDAPAQIVELFVPPAFKKEYDEPLEEARTFVMNFEIPMGQQLVNPWGLFGEEDSFPIKAGMMPMDVWIMSDADQLHPQVEEKDWKDKTPVEILHGKERLALFMGGDVSPISEEKLETPKLDEDEGGDEDADEG